MITERLMGVGSWKLRLSEETPRDIMDRLLPRVSGFGLLVVTPSPVDGGPTAIPDASMLALARYVGVYRNQPSDFGMQGVGLNVFMGDEDGKGLYTASLSVASAYTFAQWAAALRPAFLTAGVTSSIAGAYNNTYAYTTYKQPLLDVCDRFGAEWRVTNEFKFDIGRPTDLFPNYTTPKAVIVRKKGDGGRELGLRGIPGELEVHRDVEDWVRRVVMLSGAGPTATSADGSVADASVPFRAPDGSALQWTKVFRATSTVPAGSESAMASAEYLKNASVRQEFTLSTEHYDIGADVRVGDSLYVYDPERGIFDTSKTITYRGQMLNPEVIRCVGYSYPIAEGFGVYFRRYRWDGSNWVVEWIDLTRYVVWEDGETTVEVGAKPRPIS